MLDFHLSDIKKHFIGEWRTILCEIMIFSLPTTIELAIGEWSWSSVGGSQLKSIFKVK